MFMYYRKTRANLICTTSHLSIIGMRTYLYTNQGSICSMPHYNTNQRSLDDLSISAATLSDSIFPIVTPLSTSFASQIENGTTYPTNMTRGSDRVRQALVTFIDDLTASCARYS